MHIALVRSQDPCRNYKDLHDMERRYTSYLADTDNGEDQICDKTKIPTGGAWYYAERDMPRAAPSLFGCGTEYPIWLSGI